MRKKFTMLFALLLACVGVMKAEVTKFYKPGERVETLTAGQKVMFYNTTLVLNNDGTISQDRTGFLVDNGSNLGLSKTKPSQNPVFSEKVGVWTIETVEDKTTYYKVSVKGSNGYVGIAGVTNNAAARDLYIHKWMEVAADKKAGVGSENAAGGIVANADIAAGDNLWLVANGAPGSISNTWNGNQSSFATWSTGHPYAMYSVVEAETTDLEALLATAKSDALTVLESFAKLTISTAATAITEVNAVVLENNDLEAALNAIDAIVLGAKKSMDGKSIVFDNTQTDGRAGLSITAKDGNAYGTKSEGDETIWTIKSQADGSFKLYNFVTNKYLNTPGTAALTDEGGAACYKFIGTNENTVALVTTKDNKMLHQANYWGPTNYDLISWYDLNDAASLWTITEKEIKVSREQYDLATAARASLPYAIQQAYGLVTDAESYYSNWLSTQEGSYAALLDNASDTYFHSAYTDEAKAEDAETHYIQADLGEGKSIDEFYFYMAPRSGNGNNRPVNITVSGSNDNATYTKIADVTTTLDGTMNPYLSDKLGTDGTNYRYIRLTVNSTNTGTKFFTLSELYFFPATNDVTALVESYNDFATLSITETAMFDAATALINAESTLALANIKKEINALLTANASNHAETPALGQYTTEAYNALNTAYNAADATQESLEEAIAAFEAAKNVPVYFITSKHDGYAAGSAIYYDGAWKWKTANIYDRQMWMTIPSYAKADVPVVEAYDANGTSYEICDFLTGTVMRGKSVQIVKIEGWEGVYNLQYNANGGSTDAAQHAKDNGQLVNWKAATTSDSKASAWQVEYIGNSYDLKTLTDAHITALVGLQSAHDAKAYTTDAEIGEGLGQYTGDKDAIVTALNAGKVILDKTLGQQAGLTVDEINAAATAINEIAGLTINLPEEGKYYRFQGACEASLPNYYITGHTNADGGRIALTADADASTIYYFDGTNLVAYQSGLVIGLSNNHYTFASIDDNSKPASTITFAASPRKAGAYTIKSANRYFHYKVYNGAVEMDRCEGDIHAEHDWFITEVTTLPVTISAAGYATFYAPVEVTLPAEVTAHTVTANGEWATLSEAISVVPAENGVILAGVEDTYELTITTTGAEDLDNALAGTVAKTLVSKTEGDAYYVLAKQGENVGLYNPVKGEDATKFYNAGHKAYWHVVAAPQSAGYRFGEGTTAIDSVELTNDNVVIYDLLGRRVEKMEKGIYIVNGKKVIK